MDSERIASAGRQRALQVSHREALALLAALELSPFEDEALENKLLSLVYTPQSNHPPRSRMRSVVDITSHRRRAH
ncbi:MAG: hypothetical protein WAL25_11940 [Acidimicrobiia bacterium]|jgi:hypothetical protein